MKDKIVSTFSILENLLDKDSSLEGIIKKYGSIEVPIQLDYFASLSSSIVGQQLSNRVAEVLWNRLNMLTENQVTPEKILMLENETLRQIGISYSKIRYLKELAGAVDDGSLKLDGLDQLEDEEIVKQLTGIKGIGPWTAEMFLIFSMGRMDIFSVGDAGLCRAVQWLYGLEEMPSKEQLVQISEKWSPYRTIASLYLWKALDENYIKE